MQYPTSTAHAKSIKNLHTTGTIDKTTHKPWKPHQTKLLYKAPVYLGGLTCDTYLRTRCSDPLIVVWSLPADSAGTGKMVFPLGDQNTSTSTSGDTWKSTHVLVVVHVVVVVVQWNLYWETTTMRLPVLKDQMFLADGSIFKCNWTCCQGPPVEETTFIWPKGVVLQDRFYCSLFKYIFVKMKEFTQIIHIWGYFNVRCSTTALILIQWSLRFKTHLFNNSLHFKTGYQ